MGGKKTTFPEQVIYVCQGKKCSKRGASHLEKLLEHLIKEHKLKDEVEVLITECTDRCKLAPIVCFQPENIWLTETTEKDAYRVFKEVIVQGRKEKMQGE